VQEKPTSIRIPKVLRDRLTKVAAKTNVPATDIILLGLARLFDEHRSADAVLEAVIRHRKAQVQ
jgi:predicted DNA-binding protein